VGEGEREGSVLVRERERKGLILIDLIDYVVYSDPSQMIVASSLLTR
jgi:hypothetical protein